MASIQLSSTAHHGRDAAAARSRSLSFAADGWAYLFLTLGMIACLLLRIDDGVVPHDTGTLGQTAERVLNGELPHHDYDTPYTGLLCVLHGTMFRLFGVQVQALNWPLLPLTVAGFLVLYRLLRETMPIVAAATCTAAAFAWSVPNYFSAMPSWYNLFLLIFADAALLLYARTEKRRWLVVAGMIAGVSFLFKIIGLYSAAIAGLFVLFLEQRRSERGSAGKSSAKTSVAWVTIGGLVAFAGLAGTVAAASRRLPEMVTFWAPLIVLAAYLAWNERRLRHFDAANRLKRVLIAGGYFFLGMAAPVILFLIPYAWHGAVGDWLTGVFVTPLLRLSEDHLHTTLPTEPFLVGGLFLGSILGISLLARGASERVQVGLLAAVAAVVVFAGGFTLIYAGIWNGLRLVPLAGVIGFAVMYAAPTARKTKRAAAAVGDTAAWDAVFLLTASACMFSLVQLPVAHGIYFLYAAPLIIAAAASLLTVRSSFGSSVVVIFGGGLLAFAAIWLWRGNPMNYGREFQAYHRTTEVRTARGTLRYDPASASDLTGLVRAIERHSAPGDAILALPDCPEAYFLTGRRNPTRTFFDVFDADYALPERDERLLELIDRDDVRTVVFRNIVSISPQGLSDRLRRELRRRFPYETRVFHGDFPIFTVRWRDAPKTTSTTGLLSAVE